MKAEEFFENECNKPTPKSCWKDIVDDPEKWEWLDDEMIAFAEAYHQAQLKAIIERVEGLSQDYNPRVQDYKTGFQEAIAEVLDILKESEDVQCNNCGVSKTQKTEDGHWCKMCHNEM